MHANPQQREYAHRLNPDNTTDSICLHCFGTVIRTALEVEQEAAEAAHLCLPKREARFCLRWPEGKRSESLDLP